MLFTRLTLPGRAGTGPRGRRFDTISEAVLRYVTERDGKIAERDRKAGETVGSGCEKPILDFLETRVWERKRRVLGSAVFVL